MRRDAAFVALLLLGALACYAPGLGAPPAYDDAGRILLNPRLGDPGALLRHFADASPRFLHGIPLPSYYRPLTEATLALNRWIAGEGITGCRAGNLLIHAFAIVLVFLLVRRLAGAGAARWAAAFFALHPLAVQSVTYVYQRSSSLAGTLGFLSLLLYLSARETGSRLRWTGAFLAGLMAATAKECGACLFLTLAAAEWILRREGEPRRRILIRWLPFLALPALVVFQGWRILRADLPGGEDPMGGLGLSRWEYLMVELPCVARYLALNALPFPLHVVYPRPDLPFHAPLARTFLAGALLLAVLAWILLGSRHARLPRLGLALILTPLALESSLQPILDVAANQRCYPGLLGSTLLFGWGMVRLPFRRAGLAVLGLLGMLTAFQNVLWARTGGQERQDVRNAPRVMMSWGSYGRAAMIQGRVDRAEPVFRQGLRLPGFIDLLRRGHLDALKALGRREEARREEEALLDGGRWTAQAIWTAVQGAEPETDQVRLEDLAGRFQRSRLLCPEMALWLARRRGEQGRWAEAEEVLRGHLGQLPGHPLLWDHLGRILLSQHKSREAAAAYERAVALDPGLAKSWLNLGMARLEQDDPKGAEEAFRKALEAKPDYALAAKNLDAMMKRRGR